MVSVEARLKKRAAQLAPTRSQGNAAARSHSYLRDILATGNMEYRIVDSYLSGSYVRRTAVRPLNDVDVIFEIDPSFWRRGILRLLFDELPDPELIINTFANAIRYRYPSKVRRQRCSVGLQMKHLHIDVVPAVPNPYEEDSQRIWIPDRRTGRWLTTAPRLHSDIATEINKDNGGQFKPLVRLLKGWNQGLPATVKLKSFAIETMAARLFQNIALESLTDGAFAFFDFVAWLTKEGAELDWDDSYEIRIFGWRGPSLPDIAGTGGNLLRGFAQRRGT